MTKAFEFYKQSKDNDNFFAISRGETDKRTTLWHYVKECKLVYDPRSQSSHYEPAWVYVGIISDKEANNELSHIRRDRSLVGESWGNGLRFSKDDKAVKFTFGKYAGLRFDECDDYSYMRWYLTSVFYIEARKNLQHILKSVNELPDGYSDSYFLSGSHEAESIGNCLDRDALLEYRESKDCTYNAKSLIDSVLNRLSKRKSFVDEWGNKW
jgi:hypothetical protein